VKRGDSEKDIEIIVPRLIANPLFKQLMDMPKEEQPPVIYIPVREIGENEWLLTLSRGPLSLS